MATTPPHFFHHLPAIAADWAADSKTLGCPAGVSVLNIPQLASSIYVRPCYSTVSHHIEQLLIQGHHDIVLTGSPGIGKTAFAAYLLVHLIKQLGTDQADFYTRLRYVAYEHQASAKGWLLDLRASGQEPFVVCKYDLKAQPVPQVVDDAMENPTSLYICDADKQHTPDFYMARTVVISAPTEANYSHWFKQTLPSTLYMPVWSLDELQDLVINHAHCLTAAQLHALGSDPAEVATDRFCMLGGKAGLVLSHTSTELLKQELNEAVRSCTFMQLLQIKSLTRLDAKMHLLLDCQVDEETLQQTGIDAASKMTFNKVFTKEYHSMSREEQVQWARAMRFI